MITLALSQLNPTVHGVSRLPDLTVMKPEEKDMFFLRLIAANHAQTQQLQSIVDEQRIAIRDLHIEVNTEKLNTIDSVVNNKLFPEKALIWKRRTLAKLMQVNPSANATEVEQAYEINRNTRRELRQYLDSCHSGWFSCFSDRKVTLILYAKLLLNSNPLYEWETLHMLLSSANEKISAKGPKDFYTTEPTKVYNSSTDTYDESSVVVKHSYSLEPAEAARLLFERPNIWHKSLWTENLRPVDPHED